MSGSVNSENIFLLYSLGMGVFITFVYDLFRILRRVYRHSRFFVSLEDLFFWAFCAVSVFYLMHTQSDGTLRWFSVLGALFGMFLYKKTVSPFFVKWSSKGLCAAKRGIEKILALFAKPFCLLWKRTIKAGGYTVKTCCYAGNRMKKKLTLFLKTIKITLCKH